MTVLQSRINTRDAAFVTNREHMQTQVDDLRSAVHKIHQGGGEKAQARHVARGKLLPRERLNAVLDPGSPFLELSQLAAYKVYEDDVPAAGIICGIGRNIRCLALLSLPTATGSMLCRVCACGTGLPVADKQARQSFVFCGASECQKYETMRR